MGMNVNPRDFNCTPADSTKVVVRGVPAKQNTSIWQNTKTKAETNNTSQNTKHEEREMSRGKGLVRTTFNALTNFFLPNGLPGAGDVLLPSEKEILEDINKRVSSGQYDTLTPREKKLYKEHFLIS